MSFDASPRGVPDINPRVKAQQYRAATKMQVWQRRGDQTTGPVSIATARWADI